MKKVTGFVCFALTAAFIFVCAAGAHAAEITFSNDLDVKINVTLTYFDNDSGELTTKGWWYVSPDTETTITVNANEPRGIYYAAYNKDQFVDASTRGNTKLTRWVSPRMFEYTDAKPSDEGVWEGKFYKIGGSRVNIDAKPRGN